jgi:3-oxoacyl-[acyl-carrier protein] reductase
VVSADPRVVVVSGGSAGLGNALVDHYLARGDIVATFSRSRSEAIERAISSCGERCQWQAVDAADPAAVQDFAKQVLRRHRRVDALVNNAGVGVDGLLTLTRDEEIRRALAVNLESVIALTRTCLKGMLSARGGSIVNVSSVNAIRGHKGLSVYSATKAALHGFTRSLAREVGQQNIRVNAVAPGFFESAMVEHMSAAQKATIIRRTPLKKLATQADLVAAIDFLLSAPSVTGQVLAVDGGFSC